MAEAGRSPVLYLRSFAHDGSGMDLPNWSTITTKSDSTYEERLVESLKLFGPVAAIGRPTEPLPPLGAARMNVTDDCWQSEVKRLMEKASLVVIRAGQSSGLHWEFDVLISTVPPERILIYLQPPGMLPDDWWRLLPCSKFCPAPYGEYFFFDCNWTPHWALKLKDVLTAKGLTPDRRWRK